MSEVVVFSKVWFWYNESFPVLEDVSFTIEKDDFVSIIGPNGGGKTTLLKILLGILSPNRGTVRIFGNEHHSDRLKIGYVPQSFHFDSRFPITALEVVLLGRLRGAFNHRASKEERRRALDILKTLEIDDLSRRTLGELSGGQRQRVLIGRALMSEPQLLVLDEPMSNVDIGLESRFYTLLKELSAEMTILLVTHDVGVVSKLVNKVLCVNRTLSEHTTGSLNGAELEELYGCGLDVVHHHGERGRTNRKSNPGKKGE